MSIIIIAFPAAPKIDQEAKRKDQELDRLLKQKVEGKLVNLPFTTLSSQHSNNHIHRNERAYL